MYICPVCGYSGLDEPAYIDEWPSFEICPSCNYQFGYDDYDSHITFEQWRNQWIKEGMSWDKGRSKPPIDWDPERQLLNVVKK